MYILLSQSRNGVGVDILGLESELESRKIRRHRNAIPYLCFVLSVIYVFCADIYVSNGITGTVAVRIYSCEHAAERMGERTDH